MPVPLLLSSSEIQHILESVKHRLSSRVGLKHGTTEQIECVPPMHLVKTYA